MPEQEFWIGKLILFDRTYFIVNKKTIVALGNVSP